MRFQISAGCATQVALLLSQGEVLTWPASSVSVFFFCSQRGEKTSFVVVLFFNIRM